MKKLNLFVLIALMFNFPAQAGDGLAQVSLDKVFVIENGFDDNDDVQVVVDGKLPNICYRVADTEVEIDHVSKVIKLDQHAEISEFSYCKDEALSAHLSYPVNFSKELSLGKLEAGEYTVKYAFNGLYKTTAKFKVKTAPVTTVDDTLYAPVSQAIIPELIYETSNGEVILSGIFHSNCFALNNHNIEVKRERNVIIILPKLTVYESASCGNSISPLHKVVKLGPLSEGRYLLHVRSLSGKGINKIFSVVKKNLDFENGSFDF